MKKKILAIDYDKTYTLDPAMWNKFIKDAQKRGFRVMCVTMRGPEDKDEGVKRVEKVVDKLVFTCRKAKRPYLEKMGIIPDVWVDDKPEYILKNKVTPVKGKG